MSIRDSIIEAVGNGARDVAAVAAAAQLEEKQVYDNLYHLKRDGIVVTGHAGLQLAPGQRMPCKTIDPSTIALTPAVEAAISGIGKTEPKGNGAAGAPLVTPQKRKSAPPKAEAPPRGKRKPKSTGKPRKVATQGKPAKHVAAPESARPVIEVTAFGDYVILKRSDLVELAKIFALVEQWRRAIEAV